MSFRKPSRRRPRKKKSNTKKIVLIVAFLAVVAVFIVAYTMLGNDNGSIENGSSENGLIENGSSENTTSTKMKVLLETSMGNITIELRTDMPITTANFKNLIQQGVYNDTIFHRIVNLPDNLVMIQGGDPTGTGYGDTSIPSIPDEFSENAENNKNKRGTIAMANRGANTGSSQFFINGEYHSHLDNIHPVFGEVIEGMDVVDAILDVAVDPDDNYRPLEDVRLISAQLID